MGRTRRLALITAALLLAPLAGRAAPAPAVDPEVLDSLKTGLFGLPETLPTLWGADALDNDPSEALGMSLFGADPENPPPPPPPPPPVVAAPRPAPTPPPPAGPRAADQIGGISVQAANRTAAAQTIEKCITGPAWWRVTNGKTTLWIMGTPDQMPMDTVWDDTCLRIRMRGSRVAIVPAIPISSADDPLGRANTPLRPAATPLDQRLPAPLWRQLSRRIDNNPVRAQAQASWARLSLVPVALPDPSKPPPRITPPMIRTTLQVLQDTPDLYAPTIMVAHRLALSLNLDGKLGNPAAARAVDIAGRANMLIARTKNSEADFWSAAALNQTTEANQQICLKRVLDELDAGHTGYGDQAAIQAWADGDYGHALQRLNVLNTCPFGDVSTRFWSAIVGQYLDPIDRAMKAGGIAVAIVEFDAMTLKGGVLDRLKKEGFTITPPEDLK